MPPDHGIYLKKCKATARNKLIDTNTNPLPTNLEIETSKITVICPGSHSKLVSGRVKVEANHLEIIGNSRTDAKCYLLS